MRAITFPKTSDGQWVNRETDVRITRRIDGGYQVFTPDRAAATGHAEVVRYASSLAAARTEAARAVVVVRRAIATAYDAAIAEHVIRAEQRATRAGIPGPDRMAPRMMLAASPFYGPIIDSVGNLDKLADEALNRAAAPEVVHFDPSFGEPIACGITGPVRVTSTLRDVTCDDCNSALHARHFDRTLHSMIENYGEAIENWSDVRRARRLRGTREAITALHDIDAELEIAGRGCTKAHGWDQSHPFEYHPQGIPGQAGNDGYDEYERCGKRRDDPIHQMPATDTAAEPDPQVEQDPAEARYALTAEGYAAVGQPTFTCDPGLHTPNGHMCPAEFHYTAEFKTTAHLPRDLATRQAAAYVHASEVIADARIGGATGDGKSDKTDEWRWVHTPDGGCYSGPTRPGLPPVPADVDDDAAWSAYCAALPEPSTDERAEVMVEYGNPYAENIEQCRELFRDACRIIWQDRRSDRPSADVQRRMRVVMTTSRKCIETYRALARSWAFAALATQ
jgi:hypothetical protein